MMHTRLFSCLLFSTLLSANASRDALIDMFTRIEQDCYQFAREMENFIQNKCEFTSDETCTRRSYHTCDSEMPYAICPGKDLAIQKCGSGDDGGCGGLFDFTTTMTSVAPDNDSSESYEIRIKDGVCSTFRAEEYMKKVTEDSSSYWESFNVLPPALFFGTDDGVFRMLPGSPGTCPNGKNTFDPRIRPWYIAASTGPKDVLLVLDASGSMENYGRLEIMKDAAKRVIRTLAVSDYFTVIQFNLVANILGSDSLMMRATDENKEKVVKIIDLLIADGGTNFYNGFDLAFRTFELSSLNDRSSACHQAILFLSDGVMSDDESTLLKLIEEKRNVYSEKGKNPPVLFTYSFGSGVDDSVPKRIACENDGIWAKIRDGGDLAASMGAYYKYFAYGLSDTFNEDFVAWVEPYDFSTNVGFGTTASAPVYDRTVDPPVLAGVVGMDINFAALRRAFGSFGDSQLDVIDELVMRSGAVCPKLSLTKCQLESLRLYGSSASDNFNDKSSCNQCNSTIKPLKAPLCEYYPEDLWNNRLNRGRTFEERTCCKVGVEQRTIGEELNNGVCEADSVEMHDESISSSSTGLIIGLVAAGLVLSVIIYYFLRKKNPHPDPKPIIRPVVHSSFQDVVVLPPPTAPTSNQ